MKRILLGLAALMLSAGAHAQIGPYCITFDNFCDSITIEAGESGGAWDLFCDGGASAEGVGVIALTQNARAVTCGTPGNFACAGFDDFSFVFRGGVSGLFNLFGLSTGITYQSDQPYTVFPGGCGFAPVRSDAGASWQ
ncbi:MAG: hypothetical protein AAGA68_05280 [Pseudomonadota bacterium]